MAKAKQKTAKNPVEAKTDLESFDNTCPRLLSPIYDTDNYCRILRFQEFVERSHYSVVVNGTGVGFYALDQGDGMLRFKGCLRYLLFLGRKFSSVCYLASVYHTNLNQDDQLLLGC